MGAHRRRRRGLTRALSRVGSPPGDDTPSSTATPGVDLATPDEQGRTDEYPQRLYDGMRAEYRLARLMRGTFEETDDPRLLAAVAEALDGLTVEDITRRPWRVYARLARHPGLFARLLRVPGLRRRLRDAYRDR